VIKRLFELPRKKKYFIKQTDSWFFQQNVFEDKNNSEQTENYEDLLANSKFSLCPSGTGINTIRFFESLSYGSIPVLLADELLLPYYLEIDWSEIIIKYPENNVENLYYFLENIPNDVITKMSNKCVEVFNKFFHPMKMINMISSYINTKYMYNLRDTYFVNRHIYKLPYCLCWHCL